MPSPDQFLEHFKISPTGAALQKELDDARLSDRLQLAGELARINSEAESGWPKIVAEVDKAFEAVKKAELALRAAKDKCAKAVSVRTGASAVYTHTRALLERQLTESASPLIADAIEWIFEETRIARKALRTNVSRTENPIFGTVTENVNTNGGSVRDRLAALSGMREALGDLALVADQSAVPEIIARMKAALPVIEG